MVIYGTDTIVDVITVEPVFKVDAGSGITEYCHSLLDCV